MIHQLFDGLRYQPGRKFLFEGSGEPVPRQFEKINVEPSREIQPDKFGDRFKKYGIAIFCGRDHPELIFWEKAMPCVEAFAFEAS